MHPEVKKHFKVFVSQNKNKAYIIYESAILFESNSQDQFDVVISVCLDLESRIKRVIARDNTSRKKVLARINNQWQDAKKTLLSNYLITNTVLEDTKTQVNSIHKILTKRRA